ncbi:MAG: outer membrane beta-barrel protein [Bacteroidales bacterium]
MKKILIRVSVFSLAFFLCIGVYAGGSFTNLKRAELEIHVGTAIPLGPFSQKGFSSYFYDAKKAEGTLLYNGAKVGVNYGLSLAFYISDYWGVMLLFNGHSNGLNTNDFSGTDPNSRLGRLNWTTIEVDKWSEFTALAGVTFRYPIIDRLLITSKLGIGYAHLLAPFYKSQAQDKNITYVHEFSPNSEPNFGFGFGVGLKWLVSRSFHLDLRCEYMGALPFKFENAKSAIYLESPLTEDKVPYGEPSKYAFTENFHSINVSLGFSIAF